MSQALPQADVVYALELQLPAAELIDLFERAGFADRRPVADSGRIGRMIAAADIVLTARIGNRLVGVSRAITDYSYCTYLSDLAVDQAVQRRGIGRELIARTHAAAGKETMLVLIAAPASAGYYPHIGLTRHESCWTIPREQ